MNGKYIVDKNKVTLALKNLVDPARVSTAIDEQAETSISPNSEQFNSSVSKTSVLNSESLDKNYLTEEYGVKLQKKIEDVKLDITNTHIKLVGMAGTQVPALLQKETYLQESLENSYSKLDELDENYNLWLNDFEDKKESDLILKFAKASSLPDFKKYSEAGMSNNKNKVEKLIANKALFNYRGNDVLNLAFMTLEEREVYSYWFEKESDKADEFLSALNRTLNRRMSLSNYEKNADYGEDFKLVGLINYLSASLGTPLAFIDTAYHWMKSKVTGEYSRPDPYSAMYSSVWLKKASVEGLIRDIKNPDAQNLAEIGLSVAEDLMYYALGPAGLIIKSTGAAGVIATEALAEGATTNQAMSLAALTGTIEYLVDKIPVGDLVSFKSGKIIIEKSLKTAAAKVAVKGAKKVIKNFATISANYKFLDSLSDFNKYKSGLISSGMSPKEAETQTKTAFFVYMPIKSFLDGIIEDMLFDSTKAIFEAIFSE